MIEKVEKFCLENDLFSAHDRLVVACSGGPDSMALVDILRRLQHKHDLQLYIAHAEHGIRQESSLEDARYVQNYCRKYNLPFYLEHLNVPDFARERKMSMETAARVLRYRFLRKVKDATGSAKIATAHHLNDQAETFLQHLIRGAGSAGLSGMRAVNGDIVRPFLCLYRREIEAYCEKYDLQPRLDETNLSLEYERNKIRLELLPLLEKYNSGIVKSICNSAKIIAEQNDYINFSAQKVYNNICKQSADGKVHLNVLQVKQEHIALRTALYRLIIRNVQGNLENITAKHVDKIDRFVHSGHAGLILQLPQYLTAEYGYGEVIFQKNTAANAPSAIENGYNIKIEMNTAAVLPGGCIIEMKKVAKPFKITGNAQCFVDGDKLSGEIFVRTRCTGDKIMPKGMNGTKKVKDIFIDRKIPAKLRDSVPLVCDGRGIIWIAGVQQDNYYALNKDSKNIVYLSIKNL
ncbi:MAG TPA: tRNA lysidine(34) synthetase TilS [Megamonas hypermegale]|uniref:tRNA(Ile)-lysidine synthase n=1 Tax=Megamonas hypermegale TaxID=158847 RepID=A0A921HNB3_9FIRM|nr:tRNA lysidine(34) synthetase TilS [Megamonas hypermegale]